MMKKLQILLAFFLALAFAVPAAASAHTNTNGVPWNVEADDIIRHGKSFLGKPYQFGAKYGRTDRFDCSSFVKYIYRNYITLPRASKDQAKAGKFVSKSNLRKGDLVFFDTSSSRPGIDHVAVYIGNGKLLHALPKGGVQIGNMNSYWNKRYVTARRVLK